MKKVIVRRALICVFLVLPLVAFVWILSNATLFFSRLAPDGDEWAFYATRAEMMAKMLHDHSMQKTECSRLYKAIAALNARYGKGKVFADE